ncbi:hypothetical protein N9X49_01615 [Amylibacter sp.]|nr:hypothetical protein [Amylibacter sp.]
MKNIILGINMMHPDSSACLYIDSKLIGAVAEERLGKRIKHDASFPIESIKYLCDKAGIKVKDINHVAVSRYPNGNKFFKLWALFKSGRNFLSTIKSFWNRKLLAEDLLKNLASIIGYDSDTNNYKIHYVEHHLSHISASYYCSSFDDALAFSFDGSGDSVTMMSAICENDNIKIINRQYLPDSIGHFYTTICQIIGFNRFGEEYKVMGLAPYGNDEFNEEMKEVISINNKGQVKLSSKFFRVGEAYDELRVSNAGEMLLGNMFTEKLLKHFQLKNSFNASDQNQKARNLAKSAQVRFEDISLQLIRNLNQFSTSKNLCISGGCGLNGVLNAKILSDTEFTQTYHHPASSDDGNAIGAALYVNHAILKNPRAKQLFSPYLGPDFNDNNIFEIIKKTELDFREIENDETLIDTASELIFQNKVIAWFQGQAEWGPRALGNRSILANPMALDMKSIINQKVKKRESFRPFAPSVLEEDVKLYFEQDIFSPYMMHVVKFKEKWRKTFPSVTHVDGTGRLQSVTKELNPRFYSLIQSVKSKTGHGIVLNTSFNENEPIVTSPQEAIDCFMRTDIDAIFLGKYMLTK